MDCPVCKGTGVMDIPHVPGSRGGWLDRTYNWSGMECGACHGTGVKLDVEEPGEETAEQQLDRTRTRLQVIFRFSRCFPPDLTRRWTDALDGLDVWQPQTSLAVLDQLDDALAEARARFRPARDLFSLSPSREYELERHCSEIRQHLGYLRRLMEHARRFLESDPNGT